MIRMKELIGKLLLDTKDPIPIFVWGLPGGIEDILVEQIAEERGMKLKKRHMSDEIDIRGLPGFGVPEWLPREGEGILLLYDFNFSMEGMQKAAVDFFATRRIDKEDERTEMGKGWRAICTGIIPGRDSSILPLHVHLVPLFCHLGHGCDVPPFEDDRITDIAGPKEKDIFRENLHKDVREFLLQYPEYENKGRAILRTWYYLSTYLNDISLEREELTMVAEGLVGEEAAAKLLIFLDNRGWERERVAE